MMNAEDFAAELAKLPLVGILRGVTPETVLPVCDVLEASGFRLLEIPLNSPDARRSIALAAQRPGRRSRIGAGTVLTAAQAEAVAVAGGEFVISPDCNGEVIRASKAAKLVSIPGFLTPTEAFAAIRAGADYLKCFPAARLGPAYLRDLQTVIDAPMLAVGGIDADNLAEWLAAAAGAGIGGALYRPEYSMDELARRAEMLVRLAKSHFSRR